MPMTQQSMMSRQHQQPPPPQHQQQQQPHMIGQQTNAANMQQNQLIGQQSSIGEMQQQRLLASLDSTAQSGNASGGDWQEEVYQKIKTMKETYLPEINEMYQKIAAKLHQHDSLPQQPKSEQLEKLKLLKAMLDRIISLLSVSKANVLPAYKDKLSSYEKQIINFINTNRPRELAPTLQQGQLPPPHMHSMPQPQPQINQTQPHDNQMHPQLQSMNFQSPVPKMQNNMISLQHSSLSSLPGVSMAQQSMLNSLQPHDDDTVLLGGFTNANETQGNALKTDFVMLSIREQPLDDGTVPMFQAKPMSLKSFSASVVTRVLDEAAAAVGKDLNTMTKSGCHARNFFVENGMTAAEMTKCYLSVIVLIALVFWGIFFIINHKY